MSESTMEHDECLFEDTDADGHTNLCCCYALDPNDNYVDPCYHPVEDCCCCDPLYE